MADVRGDINIADAIDDLEVYNNDNIIVVTSRNGVIYSNYEMYSYENVIKLSILTPGRGVNELRAYKYGKHKPLMSALALVNQQIVLFGGEKCVSSRHTLMGLLARENIKTDRLANIPINSMISNIELDDNLKYNTVFSNKTPTIQDADWIIKRFKENPSKYNLYGAASYCLEKFRYSSTIFTLENFEKYKQNFNTVNAELKESLKQTAYKHNKKMLASYIENIYKINIVGNTIIDEMKGLDYETAHKLRNLIRRTRDLNSLAEYTVDEQFKNNTTNHILIKDNLLKYSGLESIVAEKYRLIQLETIFSEPGKSYLDFLYENNIERSELCRLTDEQAHETSSKISKLVYNRAELSIGVNIASKYKEQLTQLIMELVKHKIFVVYADNLRLWFMCDNQVDALDNVNIINNAIDKTYISTIMYRMHICNDCIGRKQFKEYSDENTIILQ